MQRIPEDTLAGWKQPASDAEEARYKWTRDEIRKALAASGALANREFVVYAKGSYPNSTNVVRDSDVDVAVELTEIRRIQTAHAADGMTMQDFGLEPYVGDYGLKSFKDDVHAALVAHFPGGSVSRGNKALHLKALGNGLHADVVPCQTHFQYTNPSGSFRKGILLRNDSDPAEALVNYPQQHYDRGVEKNNRTGRRYKRTVRILKRLENMMVEEGLINPVPSFMIESATWNAPDSAFYEPSSWTGRVRAVLAHLFNSTLSSDCVMSVDWMEANNVKFLFHNSQPWTHGRAHAFASASWDRIGLG